MRLLLATILLACSLPACPQDAPLGRLFFTAQQRATLDRQRLQGSTASYDQSASYTLNGEVRRSSGKNTRWVNGEAQNINNAPHGIIGDTYHPSSGEQRSLLGGGRIIVQPARP